MECHINFNSIFLLCLQFLVLLSSCVGEGFSSINPVKDTCLEEERQALLSFKDDLVDLSGKLSSWSGHACCQWHGISCNNRTGHVEKIDLPNTYPYTTKDEDWNYTESEQSPLKGKLNPSLITLKHLSYLDLSYNDFEGSQLPKFILNSLRYLNLSYAFFQGEIPSSFGNLSNLNYLDLGTHYIDLLFSNNLNWVSNLSSLKYLCLQNANLSSTGVSWLHDILILPSLVELHLSGCRINQSLPHQVTPHMTNHRTSLLIFDLSYNHLGSTFPIWLLDILVRLKSLEYLDLSNTELQGQIPRVIGQLCKLKLLDLSFNNIVGDVEEFLSGFSSCQENGEMVSHLQHLNLFSNSLSGSFPESFRYLPSLKTLDLSYNRINGSIHHVLGQLSQLVELHLHGNAWRGVLTEAHFVNLTRLDQFEISTNLSSSLVFNVSYDWLPPFNLSRVNIQNCLVGPGFPAWLQSQTHLVDVLFDNTGLSGPISEDWFMKISSQLEFLQLPNNHIGGELPFQFKFPKIQIIDLSHNQFEGNLLQLDAPELTQLFLSDNQLKGSIPPLICQLQNMSILSLRNNQFSGEFPQEWSLWSNIDVVDISNNNLSGNIPSSMGIPSSLGILKINKNHFVGEIPSSLQNCSVLFHMDLSDNKLSGVLPKWIGYKLSELEVVQLRFNNIRGSIPRKICNLQSLHILDLSHNNISGHIPTCMSNMTTLRSQESYFSSYDGYELSTTVIMKGSELEYSVDHTLPLVTTIDFSSNNLRGEIPQDMSALVGLGSLNLSSNQLSGDIPWQFGNLTKLETLDLSHNHLSGEIPKGLSSLSSLSHLGLSYNNLSGRIPSGFQLQTLDNSSYIGNPLLCGFPLSTKCEGDDVTNQSGSKGSDSEDDEDDDNDKLGFYISMVIGFAFGFWGVCGTLVVNKKWRYAFIRFFDNIKDKIVVTVILKTASLRTST